ncbi:hypothetical protein DFJ43DRAFT_1104634 [Lentinula guzmanii]|uniref:Uncharacterized protein n=1 Tax=Lentinula guzmanii TaxID=2804957 RepID=A0AA38J9J1_9AGAR|nr:hypothetical protein DFJ43DRAFT_1104634 [Lentinula guzmanii]
MVYSHTVLTAVIAVGAASTVGAAPLPPSANPMGVVGVPGSGLPNDYVLKNVAPLPTRELDARELDIILEEKPHKHSHHHHHHHHHFGGKHHHHDDEELEVHFEEDNSHYHHGEEEVEVEFKEEHRDPHFHHHGEEEEDFEVEFKEEHRDPHFHHHGEEEQHVYHHIHEHEHPIQAEHQKFNHPMGMPPKVEKDEFWIVEVEDHGHPIHMERRQDPDAGAAPAPADPSQTTPPPAQGGRLRNKFHQWQQSPGGQKVSAKLHNQLDKHFPVAGAGAGASSASASAPPPPDAQFSRRSGSQIESSTDTGDGSNGSVAKNSQGQALASQEWKAIKTVHPKWRNDMDLSGGDWEKFLQSPTGEAVKEKGDAGLEAMVKKALKQHTASAQRAGNASGSTVAGSSPATSPSGSSYTSNPSTAASSMGRRAATAPAGAGSDDPLSTGDSSTGSPSMGSPGKSDALANNPSSPSSTTSSSGPSGVSKERKHHEEWKEVEKISSFKADMEASKGDFTKLLKTPTGEAIQSKGADFEAFVKAHHMKKHHRHHQNQNPESSIADNGSGSAPSSAQSTTSATTSSTNNSPSLEARFGFAAHDSYDLNPNGSARPLRSHGRARALPYASTTSDTVDSQSSAPGAEATGNQPSTPLTSADPTSSSSNGSPLSGQHGPPNGPHDHLGNEGPHAHGHHGNEGPHDHKHHHHHGDQGPNALQGNQQGGMPPSQNSALTVSTSSGRPGSSFVSGASTSPITPSSPQDDTAPSRALQRVRRSNPFGPFGADLD